MPEIILTYELNHEVSLKHEISNCQFTFNVFDEMFIVLPAY